jgi:hypothetical protein
LLAKPSKACRSNAAGFFLSEISSGPGKALPVLLGTSIAYQGVCKADVELPAPRYKRFAN